jgi:hypothetical protein
MDGAPTIAPTLLLILLLSSLLEIVHILTPIPLLDLGSCSNHFFSAKDGVHE